MGTTIRSAIDGGEVINAHCEASECGHSAQLVLRRLGERLGFDHGYLRADLIGKLKCSRCGSKRIGLTYSHKSVSSASATAMRSAGGGSSYAKSKGR